MDKELQELVERLRAAYGDGLQSVILYGSAAGGDYVPGSSDMNVMCILREVGVTELETSRPITEWWKKQKQPAPLLLGREELHRACDAFPIEFLDLIERHRILHGEDVIKGMVIEPRYHRAQLENELRAKLLRFRARYAAVAPDAESVVRLMVEALPNFAALFRHVLLVSGQPAPTAKADVFRAAGQQFGFDPQPFLDALDVRQGVRKGRSLDARATFTGYLAGVVRMTAAVDGLLVQ